MKTVIQRFSVQRYILKYFVCLTRYFCTISNRWGLETVGGTAHTDADVFLFPPLNKPDVCIL